MNFCPECHMRFVKFIKKDGVKFGICVNKHQIRIDNPSIVYKQEREKDFDR